MFGETFLAVYRAVSGRLKRDFALGPAVSADSLVKASFPEIIIALSPVETPRGVISLERTGKVAAHRRPFHGTADQGVDLSLQRNQLLLHLKDKIGHIRRDLRFDLRLIMRFNCGAFAFSGLFFHFAPYPVKTAW
jgi:hypothetical protein